MFRMGTYKLEAKDFIVTETKAGQRRLLSPVAYEQFNVGLLGLGDITQRSRPVEAVAAVFDLEGFTSFCKQIDPQLSVPLFLSEFLTWLFGQIKEEMTEQKDARGAVLWCPLPFFVKFMGDGLLVLWNASDAGDVGKYNIITAAHEICKKYRSQFISRVETKLVNVPKILRCGIARGAVYSVGDGNDFVGSCVNIAARLQKIEGLTFAFNVRGFTSYEPRALKFFDDNYLVKKMAIRGIGEGELVAVLKVEFQMMKDSQKKQFYDR